MKRTAVLAFASAVVVVVGFGATGFACTSLATLNMSSSSGLVGDSLTVTGSSFRIATDTAPAPAVSLLWGALDGPVLAQATPDGAGNISATFAVPESPPGSYVVIARQLNDEGKDQYGTPARASFQVLAPGGQPVTAPAVSSRAYSTASSGSSGAVTLALGLGALGLVLFGAGFMAVVRQTRRQAVPATAPAPRPEA